MAELKFEFEFPLNLDGVEQWLPSDDIFHGEVRSKHDRARRIGAPSTDELVQRLASLSLFRSRARAKSPAIPSYQRFRPQVQSAPELYRVNNGVSVGAFTVDSSSKPVRECNFVKPTRLQVESFLEARARLLQRQQNRFHSRLMPVQGRSGAGSGGTGVFLPRAVNTTTTTTTNSAGFGKKQRLRRNRREVQAAQQRHSMKRAGLDNLEEQFPPSPEMDFLPEDWTY